jgi:phosphoserine phosphatase RsbU/P
MTDVVNDAVRMLLDRNKLLRAEDLPDVVREAAAVLGADEAVILLVDMHQLVLVPLTNGREPAQPVTNVEGTLAGRAFTDITTQHRTAPALTVYEPLLDGAERLGVLGLTFPFPDRDAAELHAECRYLAAVVAEMLVARDKYGDVIARTRRREPMQVPAEVQWQLLPPLTFGTPDVVISGTVEPAYDVGGDCFDYAVNGDTAHVALIDAMGHGLGSALLSTVAIGALRNARRAGLDLIDTVRSMDKWLTSQFGDETFVTAVVAELDVQNGVYRWVNAGHPPALLLREGSVVKALSEGVNAPLGLLGDVPTVEEERLQPGDRLLLHSDGVVDARNADREYFGTDRLIDFVTKAAASQLPAPETLRRLNHAILEHQGGYLQDDATTMLVEWRGDTAERLLP